MEISAGKEKIKQERCLLDRVTLRSHTEKSLGKDLKEVRE